MPVDVHKSTPHNLKTGYNMQELNRKAFKYMFRHKEHIKIPLKDVKCIMRRVVNNCSGIL